jgi:hypothetical protein
VLLLDAALPEGTPLLRFTILPASIRIALHGRQAEQAGGSRRV